MAVVTVLHNYLVTLEWLECWLGGTPAGHLVQLPTQSCTLTRRRSCKQWLSLAKPWKCPYGRFHSPWATNSLFREVYWSPASASQAMDGGWCPSVHHLALLRRIWLPNYYSYPSGSCRLLLNHLLVSSYPAYTSSAPSSSPRGLFSLGPWPSSGRTLCSSLCSSSASLLMLSA